MNYYLKRRSINLVKYGLQLNKLKWAIHQKWPELANRQRHCISSRQHKSCFGHPTRHTLLEQHIWNVFSIHLLPGFVLSNYHLFRSFQNNSDNFTSLEDKKLIFHPKISDILWFRNTATRDMTYTISIKCNF